MSITVKRAERSLEICTDLTMLDKVDELNRKLSKHSDQLADPERVEAARELSKLSQQLDENTLVVKLQAVTGRAYAEALAQSSVEKDAQHPEGTDWFNVVKLLAPEATVEVKWKTGEAADFQPDMDWPALMDSMSDFQCAQLLQTVVGLGRETGAGPKAVFRKASSILQNSARN